MNASTKIRLITLSCVAAVALAACGSGGGSGGTPAQQDALPKVEAPAGRTWSQTVVATDAGFRMGNPDAPLKLVEYASPTCVHCRDFSRSSAEELKRDFVDSGRVSVEFRPFMLNAIDVVIMGIIGCAGPERAFPLLENMYGTHDEMMTRLQASDQAAVQAADALPENQRFIGLARAMGLDTFFASRGVPTAEINRCLADPANATRWATLTETASREQEITQTPTLILNGERIEAPAGTENWPATKAALQAAGAR